MSKKYLDPLNNFKNMYIFLYSNRKSLFKEFKWVWTQMRFRPETLTGEIRERWALAGAALPSPGESAPSGGSSAERPGPGPGGERLFVSSWRSSRPGGSGPALPRAAAWVPGQPPPSPPFPRLFLWIPSPSPVQLAHGAGTVALALSRCLPLSGLLWLPSEVCVFAF